MTHNTANTPDGEENPASKPDFLSILTHKTLPLAKTWRAGGDISDYSKPKHFLLETVEVDSIHNLSTLLFMLENNQHACIIRGRYIGDTPQHTVRRKEVFDDQPLHTFLAEVDKFRPALFDPIADAAEAVEEYITTCLPECFHGISYHWQLSNSAGAAKNAGILKAHIWFFLETPYTSAQLKAWGLNNGLKEVLDVSVLDPIQVHYTSAPVFEPGVKNPVPVRSGFVRGSLGDAVPLVIDADSAAAKTKESAKGEAYQGDDPIALWLEENSMAKGTGDNGKVFFDCPFAAESHTDGKIGETDTTYLPPRPGFPDGIFHCSHASCAERTNSEFENALGITASYFEVLPPDKEENRNSAKLIEKTIHAPTLQDKPVPERQWIIDNWLLHNCVTALYGDGGVGKSLLAMMMLTCISLGIDFLGLKTKKMKVLGFFCEDTEDELHRRQADINHHYMIDFSDLENLHWQSRVGCDNVLMEFLREGAGKATVVYNALREEVLRVGARFVAIDTGADTFGGNENIRPQVRQFINQLGKLALEIDGAVMLCLHPSAAGLARNDGTGGSTAWNNTVRSRLYLSRPQGHDRKELSEQDAQGLRELTKKKANYSTIGDKIILRWYEGAFRVEGGSVPDVAAQAEQKNREQGDEQIFLALLDRLNGQGRSVSNSKNATNYAPKIMSEFSEGTAIGKKRLGEAMMRLFALESIDRGFVGIGTDRKKKEGIRRRPA